MNNHIRALEAAQAPSTNSINPLIEGTETADNVRCALEFLADAISSLGDSGQLNEINSHGMNVLLRTCAAALVINPNNAEIEEREAA